MAPVRARKTSGSPFVSLLTKLLAEELNPTKRPSALKTASTLIAFAWLPSLATDTRVVLGVQGPLAPRHVSRKKISAAPLVSSETRLVACDWKAAKRPSALKDGPAKPPGSPSLWLPSAATETRIVEGVHGSVAPRQGSRAKESPVPFVSPGTRLLENERKPTR